MASDGGYEARPAAKSNNTLWIVLVVVAAGLVMMCMIGGILLALLLPAVQQAREAARRSQSQNNLKQIALGAHNFHDTFNHFPPFVADGSDDPQVTAATSFHTAMLPYMEQQALFESIDKTIPWDDGANKPSYASVVEVYISPHFDDRTDPTGYGVTHYVPNSQIVPGGAGLPMGEITDGSSNTMLAGSIGAAFPAWGDPANPRDGANGFAGGPNAFGGVQGGAVIGLADGSVRYVRGEMSPEVAAALASPAGGEDTSKYEY